MIFARDKSQMCNNLLQFAHVFAWAREHNRSVMSMRFSYKYPFFKISHTKFVSFPLYLIAKYAAALRLIPTASFKHSEFDADKLEKQMLQHKNIVVSGWYVRFYDLFLKYREEICDLFTIDPQYTEPIKHQMQECKGVRLGIHIRRGDYANWKGGMYYYDDRKYSDFITQFAALKPKETIDVYISTNDSIFNVDSLKSLLPEPRIKIHLLGGSSVQDLFMLSECDYIIGPPSTFSLVAAMYRDIPLCRMDTVEGNLKLSDFRLFDYWFRRLV